MKLLDKWMEDYKQNIYNRFVKTKELNEMWNNCRREQKTFEVNGYDKENSIEIPEMKSCCCWKITKDWRRVEYTLNGINKTFNYTFIVETIHTPYGDFDELLYEVADYELRRYESYKVNKEKHNGLAKLLGMHGCLTSEVDWVMSHDENTYMNKAEKLMLVQKKAIEAKVLKICGETLTNIDDTTGEIYVKGSNGRVAHLWAIVAGGYNIQCKHIRILVKEIK